MMDWDKIEQLLNIVEKAARSPKLGPITQAAMTELEQHAKATVQVRPTSRIPITTLDKSEEMAQPLTGADEPISRRAGERSDGMPSPTSVVGDD